MAAHSLGSVKVLVQVLDLLGLPPLGVPRLDDAPTLADLVDAKAKRGDTASVWHHDHPAHATVTNTHPDTRPTATVTGLGSCRPGDTARWQHPPAAERPARHLTRHRPARPAHNHRTPDRPGR